MRTVNVILIKLITVVKVYLANPVTKRCRRFRDMNFLFGRGKKKLAGKRWGLRVPSRVCDVEGGAAHLATSCFDGTV